MSVLLRLLLLHLILGHIWLSHAGGDGPGSCKEPAPVANAYRDWEGGHENTWVRYECMDGYQFLEGDLQRQCIGGNYSGTPPVCLLNCGPPLNYTHATPEVNGTMSEDVVQYACVKGTNYTKKDNEMFCDPAPGRWMKPIHCADNDPLSHSIIFHPLSTQADMDATNDADISASESESSSSTDFYEGISSSAVFTRISASIVSDTYDTSDDVTHTVEDDSLQPSGFYTTDIQSSSQRTEMLTATPPFSDVTSVPSDVIITSESVVVAPSEVNETCPRQNGLKVKLNGGPYEVLQVVLVRPPNEDIYNFRLYVTSPTTNCDTASRLDYEDRTTIRCPGDRLFPQGESLVIQGSGSNDDTLRICDVEVYGRVPSVDCGNPDPYPGRRAVYTSTALNSSAIYYCSATYHFRGGKQWVNCSKTGYWKNYSLKCSDKEKIDLVPSSNNTNYSWLDNDVTTCSPVNGSEVHVTLDLGSKYEVKMVTITTQVNSTAASLTFNVLRDGLRKECTVNNPPLYTHESGEITVAVGCPVAPVGDSIELLVGGLNGSLCEIKVFGRPFRGEPIECRQVSNGKEYKGSINMTVTGQECQPWPTTKHDLSDFPDMTWAEAGSSCRNPDGHGSPWCYTNVTSGAWEDCPIVRCDSICLRYPDGSTYQGTLLKTETGKTCRSWSDSSVEFKRTALFPGASLGHQFCRNPSSSMSKPWCYTSKTLQYDYCAVPTCPVESEYTTTYYRLDHIGVLQDFETMNFSQCFLWTKSGNSAQRRTNITEEEALDLCGSTHSLNMTILCEKQQPGGSNWSYAIFECVYCGTPFTPDNMDVSFQSTYYPSVANYTCGTGYVRDRGTGNFTCLSSGDWDNATLECIVDCSDPPSIPGTNISYNITTLGSLAEYTCLLTNETVYVNCTTSGDWQMPTWHCSVDCGLPSSFPNMNVTFNLTYTDEMAVYACVDGYQATSGYASVVCKHDGQWTMPTLVCTELTIQTDSTTDSIQIEFTLDTPTSASSIRTSPTNPSSTLQLDISSTVSSSPASSALPTSPSPVPTTPSHCPPRCICARVGTPDSAQIELIKQQIAKSLLIDVKTLSKEKRKYTSAPDGRTSATAIGHTAWIFMVIVFGLLFLTDMVNLVRGVIVIVSKRSRRFKWTKH